MFGLSAQIFLVAVALTWASKVDRPRGVSLTKKVLYDPDKDFSCLDGSGRMPFSHVNDDYCDCNDGSDEPGTSACPNGSFHCTNAGFKPQNIPSSRVNDKICDCCDGSDEWKNTGLCQDNCKELWRVHREKLIQQANAATRGVQLRKEYSAKGVERKAQDQEKVAALREEMERVQTNEESLKLQKESTEKAENDAKDVERTAWTGFKEKVQQQQESRQAANAFTEMDANKDGIVSLEELRVHDELDDSTDDGEFTVEEAEALLGAESVEAPEFIEVTWSKISGKYVTKAQESQDEEKHDTDLENEEAYDDENEDDDSDLDEDLDEPYPEEIDDHEYENDLDEDYQPTTEPPIVTIPSDEPDKVAEKVEEESPKINLPDDPVWSSSTKILIDAAEEARKAFQENEKKKTDLDREIKNLERKMAMDFGPDEAFSELHGKCFEYSTHEYTYRLCPFDKASQRANSGGSETNLGRWGTWSGKEDNIYSSMKYTNGLRCWNGPDRSCEVKISCGDDNKLLSASEPSRCEYRFEFVTPAACEVIAVPDKPHDEL